MARNWRNPGRIVEVGLAVTALKHPRSAANDQGGIGRDFVEGYQLDHPQVVEGADDGEDGDQGESDHVDAHHGLQHRHL